jgi:hypothetical protein
VTSRPRPRPSSSFSRQADRPLIPISSTLITTVWPVNLSRARAHLAVVEASQEEQVVVEWHAAWSAGRSRPSLTPGSTR